MPEGQSGYNECPERSKRQRRTPNFSTKPAGCVVHTRLQRSLGGREYGTASRTTTTGALLAPPPPDGT